MIQDIATHLPLNRLNNEDLVQALGRWTPDEVFAKTGIRSRCIAAPDETAVDLGEKALTALLNRQSVDKVDFLLFCTQTGDYKLPSSACILQSRAKLSKSCGCLDLNLACSGFIYGLMIAEGLLKSGISSNVALVNCDTYTHYIHPKDAVCRPIFGDGAAATLLTSSARGRIIGFDFGSDGDHALKMYLPAGGERMRSFRGGQNMATDSSPADPEFIRMDGPEIYNFTLHAVPPAVQGALAKGQLGMKDIDYFVFHQANAFMLESLRRKMNIPKEKYVIEMADTGNLVSASIPVVLAQMRSDARIKAGTRTLLCGFGVGLSWAACIVEW